jgi:hypothetical protein
MIREESSACLAEEEQMESAMAKDFNRVWGDAAGT